MESKNMTTTVTEFVLLGLTQSHKLQYCLYVIFFLIYVITWLLNFTIIATVAVDHQLHTPMCNVVFAAGNDGGSLPFCGPNVLDNFYCDVPQVIKLACSDTRKAELQMVFNSGVILISLFVILIISYIVILLKIRTCITEGKRKALSTCGTQITVVSLIFIPCIFTYAQPYKKYPRDKVVSVVYTVVTPMLNPMIYTLRNTEMKKAIRRTLGKIFLSAGKQKPERTVGPKTSNLVLP
ncbi:olfactory receptor 4D1-like isoform X2 [Passer domesticus]|uniref:olfactory receptor 4D1-like isoform X2 n=1 Tax=Passer domesticus TaxID=48849 RepID=UPI0030FF2585